MKGFVVGGRLASVRGDVHDEIRLLGGLHGRPVQDLAVNDFHSMVEDTHGIQGIEVGRRWYLLVKLEGMVRISSFDSMHLRHMRMGNSTIWNTYLSKKEAKVLPHHWKTGNKIFRFFFLRAQRLEV